ncbi:MAG: threonine/serine dehydratase [Gemmatimonadales bacterium]
MPPAPDLGRDRLAAVHRQIAPHVRRTPLIEAGGGDFGLDPSVRLAFKLELCQHTGSFKPRGAFANLLLRKIPPAGIAAASGGNHGVAVAYAARQLNLRATIFVPTVASPVKLQQIRSYGAELVVEGELYADALAASERWIASSGAMPVHAYDQVETLLGASSVAHELEEQAPDLDSVLIAVGGGGLLGGSAAWYAGRNAPACALIGVEPELAPTLTRALAAGRPVDAEAGGIAADSLAPRRVGELTFPLAQRHVREVLLVSDEAIRTAQEALWRVLRLVVEPGGAAAFAAVLSGGYRPREGERVGVVICGGNTTAVDFRRA